MLYSFTFNPCCFCRFVPSVHPFTLEIVVTQSDTFNRNQCLFLLECHYQGGSVSHTAITDSSGVDAGLGNSW